MSKNPKNNNQVRSENDEKNTSKVERPSRLKYMPITLFGSVLGLSGLSIAFLKVESLLKYNWGAGQLLLYFTTAWFIVLTALFIAKAILHFDEIKEEFNHPIKLNFFSAYSISILLLAIGYKENFNDLSKIMWYIGSTLHLLMLLKIVNMWIYNDFEIHTFNPAWFIPVVGAILVPVVGTEHAPASISWFFFSIGLVFWLLFFTIVMYRIIFHTPLPQNLHPTLFILMAPPAIAFISVVKLTDEVGVLGNLLYYFTIFIALLLATTIKKYLKMPFFISWWALTFPMSALTISTLLMYHKTGNEILMYATLASLAVTTILNIYVLIRSIIAEINGEICRPEKHA